MEMEEEEDRWRWRRILVREENGRI